MAKLLLTEKKIEAYIEGVSTSGKSYDWYYEGSPLAVALALSWMLAISIEKAELVTVLELICGEKRKEIDTIGGFKKELRNTIGEQCSAAGFEFKFLNKIGKRRWFRAT